MGGRASIAVLVAASSLWFAAAAYACSPDAYMTDEELASGRYDTSMPWWAQGGGPHTHAEPGSSGTTQAPAPPPAEQPALETDPAPQSEPATPPGSRDAAQAPVTRSDARPDAPAPSASPAPPAASALSGPASERPSAPAGVEHVAGAPSAAGLVKIPVAARDAAARDRAERRAVDRPTVGSPRAFEPRTVDRLPLEPRPVSADGRGPAAILAAAAIALFVLLAAAAAAVRIRRRSGLVDADRAAAETSMAADDAEIEAELQELVAEQRAKAARGTAALR